MGGGAIMHFERTGFLATIHEPLQNADVALLDSSS